MLLGGKNLCNPRPFFCTIDRLLKPHSPATLPASTQLWNTFLDFFFLLKNWQNKTPNSYHTTCVVHITSWRTWFYWVFSLLDSASLNKLVSNMKSSTCIIDPIPTHLFKSYFSSLCPIIFNILSDSLSTGFVPTFLKTAAIIPGTKKKPNMALDNLNNFRPISNLPFNTEILERAVLCVT